MSQAIVHPCARPQDMRVEMGASVAVAAESFAQAEDAIGALLRDGGAVDGDGRVSRAYDEARARRERAAMELAWHVLFQLGYEYADGQWKRGE